MSLAVPLHNALSGLKVAQNALNTTANNVANVNTPGYSRQIANQESVTLDGRGAGARALNPSRAVDEYLNTQLREQRSALGRSEALVRYNDRIADTVLGAPGEADRGIANRIKGLTSAAEALATTPEKAATRQAFLGAVEDLLGQIRADGDAVQGMRRDADREIGEVVSQINDDLQALEKLNEEIARTGATPNLLDQRDRLIGSLGEKIEISTYQHDNGTVAVYSRGGELLDRTASVLDYRPSPAVGEGVSFNPIKLFGAHEVDGRTLEPLAGAAGQVIVTGGVRAVLTPELAADAIPDASQQVRSPFATGRLQGLLEARDRVLPELADQLGELARLTRYTLNAAHNTGAALPPPQTLVGTRTDLSGFSGATATGTAYVAVINKATGAAVTTIEVTLSGATPGTIADQIDTGLGALGDASINADGALEITLTSGAHGLATAEGDSRIPLGDASGRQWDYGFAHYFGLNDLVVEGGGSVSRLALRPDIQANPARLSQAALTINAGAPTTASLGGVTDNRPALALAEAMQRETATVARGALSARQVSLGEYAADIISTTAIAADRARTAEASTRALVGDLEVRQSSVSGVNLDEELSKLIMYQQAYAVSARVISITNELFDELLNIKR